MLGHTSPGGVLPDFTRPQWHCTDSFTFQLLLYNRKHGLQLVGQEAPAGLAHQTLVHPRMSAFTEIINTFVTEYKKTPARVKIVDGFIVYALATAVVQLVYMLVVGSFPFNAFLAGFLSSLGFFSLASCLRLQIDPANTDFTTKIAPERAFADFTLANLVLHLVVWNYIG